MSALLFAMFVFIFGTRYFFPGAFVYGDTCFQTVCCGPETDRSDRLADRV